ncbi:hypothetical protein PICSAR28_01068 [Mycobacterium avium subsp. paratuberculosis]|nr:hypothetical protein PICSAR28_01068 [Mycobacterium avium subsp. paratuberculosis]
MCGGVDDVEDRGLGGGGRRLGARDRRVQRGRRVGHEAFVDDAPDRGKVDQVDVGAVGVLAEARDRQGVQRQRPPGQLRGPRGELHQVQPGVDGDVVPGDLQQLAQPADTGQRAAAARRLDQRNQERLLAAGPVEIGEGAVVFVAPLPHEGHRLGRVDALHALVEVGPRIAVPGVAGQAHRDRLDRLGDLEEGAQGDLDEVVDRDAQKVGDGADLGLAAGLAGGLLASGQVGGPGAGIPGGLRIQRLLIGQPVGLFDLAGTHRSRAARQLGVVVARDRHRGDGPVTIRKMNDDKDIGVVAAGAFVAGVQRVVDFRRQRPAVLVQPAVQAHQQDVLVVAERHRPVGQGMRDDDPAQRGVIAGPADTGDGHDERRRDAGDEPPLQQHPAARVTGSSAAHNG